MARAKILIVDDDADHRHGLNRRLRANNYDTAFAVDAVQALSVARRKSRTSCFSTSVCPAVTGSW